MVIWGTMSSPTRLAAAQMVGTPGGLAVTRTPLTLPLPSMTNLNDLIINKYVRIVGLRYLSSFLCLLLNWLLQLSIQKWTDEVYGCKKPAVFSRQQNYDLEELCRAECCRCLGFYIWEGKCSSDQVMFWIYVYLSWLKQCRQGNGTYLELCVSDFRQRVRQNLNFRLRWYQI